MKDAVKHKGLRRRQLLGCSLCVPAISLFSAWARAGENVSLWHPPRVASLEYDMQGRWKTNISGSGYLDWNYEPESSIYTMKLSIEALLMTFRYHSIGFLDKNKGMLPTMFREKRTKREERIVNIDQLNNKISYSWKSETDDKPLGVQDVTSIMLQFGFLLSTAPEKAQAGQVYTFPVVRMGNVKQWDFLIKGQTILKTNAGKYNAWHIQRLQEKEDKDSDLQVEFWLVPELRYMPQKILFNMKNDSYLQVSLKKIHVLE